MNHIFKYILAVVLTGGFSVTWGQEFDLMASNQITKVAESPNFVVANNTINFYASSGKKIISTFSGDTMLVARIPGSTTSATDQNIVAHTFGLDQNFPNPFNISTVIRFSLPERSTVTITVYDITGREIATVVDGAKPAGVHSVGFGNNQISTGTYFYRMTALTQSGKQLTETKKMIVMK